MIRTSPQSEMYLRKISPRTMCLYYAYSTLPRSLFAVFHNESTKFSSPLVLDCCGRLFVIAIYLQGCFSVYMKKVLYIPMFFYISLGISNILFVAKNGRIEVLEGTW